VGKFLAKSLLLLTLAMASGLALGAVTKFGLGYDLCRGEACGANQ
jgi:hypothetical protein